MPTAVPLTEYERKRQEQIAKNKALLRDLDLQNASATFMPKGVKRKSEAPAARQAKRKSAPKQPEVVEPKRFSMRIRGVRADDEVANEKREAEEQEKLAKIEAERAKKRQRVGGDLNLSDITSKNDWLWDPKDGEVYMLPKEGSVSKELSDLRERFSNLTVWKDVEPNAIKITPERVYSAAFHPNHDKALIVGGDKVGNLGIFDSGQSEIVKSEDDEMEDELKLAITTLKAHSRTITGVVFNPSYLNGVYTCSYDASIRKFDFQTGVSSEILALNDYDNAFTCMQFVADKPDMAYFSTLSGLVGVHDIRTGSTQNSSTQYFRLSESKIGGFGIHPTKTHLLAAGSLDRSLRLWDLRMMSGKGEDKKPHMVGEHLTRLSVSNAAFNTVGQVAAASYDDTVKIYDFAKAQSSTKPITLSEKEMQPSVNIPHNNQTGKWVTIFKPVWQAKPIDDVQKFCIANMDRSMDVYDSNGMKLAKLAYPGISAVPAATAFHPQMDWIAGVTASGKVCLYMPSEN